MGQPPAEPVMRKKLPKRGDFINHPRGTEQFINNSSVTHNPKCWQTMVPRTWWLAAIWPVTAGILGPMLGVLVSRMQINHKFCIVYFEPGAFSQIFFVHI